MTVLAERASDKGLVDVRASMSTSCSGEPTAPDAIVGHEEDGQPCPRPMPPTSSSTRHGTDGPTAVSTGVVGDVAGSWSPPARASSTDVVPGDVVNAVCWG